MIIYRQNSAFVLLSGFGDQTTDPPTYINNATLKANLTDDQGRSVSGLTDVTGQYVANSNGNYQFPIDPSFNPPDGVNYTLTISGTGAGFTYKSSTQAIVATR